MDDFINSDRVNKFNRWEKIFFRIELAVIFIGLFFYILFLSFIEDLAGLAETWIQIFMLGWVVIIVNFAIAVIRILKYIFSIRKEEGKTSLWRSTLTIILSPPAFILYYVLIFVATISGCSVL